MILFISFLYFSFRSISSSATCRHYIGFKRTLPSFSSSLCFESSIAKLITWKRHRTRYSAGSGNFLPSNSTFVPSHLLRLFGSHCLSFHTSFKNVLIFGTSVPSRLLALSGMFHFVACPILLCFIYFSILQNKSVVKTSSFSV